MAPLSLAVLLLASLARADEASDIVKKARASNVGKSCVIEAADRFCSNETSCQKWCHCACDWDVHAWGRVDYDTKCPRAPQSGPGMIPKRDASLVKIPDLGPYIVNAKGKLATQATIDGLLRLSDWLAKDPDGDRAKYGYKIDVRSCYRPAVGDPKVGDGDVEHECSLIMAATYMLKKEDLSDDDRAKWTKNLNPPKKGLTWPGATPHSAGVACDLVLQDKHGYDSFDWRAGVEGSPTSSIKPQKKASELLDRALTNSDVGAKRLNYEAWHYEWGGPDYCRCKYPDCGDKHWPPTGSGGC
jgi:hypothetical protein